MPISLANLQRARTATNEVAATEAACDWNLEEDYQQPPEGSIAPLNAANGSIRLLQMRDRNHTLRNEWISKLDIAPEYVSVSPAIDIYHAQAARTFEVMIISGDDVQRVSRLIKDVRASLPSKVLICLLSKRTAECAALLLKAGADDVFHLKMPPQEANARLAAFHRRLEWRVAAAAKHASQLEASRARELLIRAWATRELSQQEFNVLALLWQRQGTPTPVWSLRSAAGGSSRVSSRRCLHVVICKLRRALVSGAKIITHDADSYSLKINKGRMTDILKN